MEIKKTNFFNVITQNQTYSNTLYLLLSFPLGLFYFVFLITGLSLGIGLTITLFGIPILVGMLFLWRIFAVFECKLTELMLNIDISTIPLKQSKNIWGKILIRLRDSFTWKGLAYLFIKFPLGIFSFIVLVTLLSVSLSMAAVPILHYLTEIEVLNGTFCITQNNVCFVNNYFIAITTGIIGIFLFFVSLHVFNGLAHVFGLLTKVMLEKKK